MVRTIQTTRRPPRLRQSQPINTNNHIDAGDQFRDIYGPSYAVNPAYTTNPVNADDHEGSYNPLPLVFPFGVGTLHNIAAVSVAASLMQYKFNLIRKLSDDNGGLKLLALRKIPETDLISIPLPTAVKQKITALLPVMHKRLKEWNAYHHRIVFWDIESCGDISLGFSEWLDEIVWMSDGTINYGQTAEKMLQCGKMIEIKKYRLACMYCFESCVRSLALKLGHKRLKWDHECHFRSRFGANPLYDYWYHRLVQLDKSHVENEIHDQINTLLRQLSDTNYRTGYHHNFNAIEYLWNDQPNKDRMLKQNKIGNLYNPLCTWRVLVDLKAYEFDVVIEADGSRILHCFSMDPRFEEIAITIWRYMLDRIVDDEKLVHNFQKIRDDDSFVVTSADLGYLNFYDTKHKKHMIQRMWQCTPERLRSAIGSIAPKE